MKEASCKRNRPSFTAKILQGVLSALFYFVTGYGLIEKMVKNGRVAQPPHSKKKSTEKNIVENFKERNKKEILQTGHFPLNEQRCMRSREDFVKYNAPL